MGDNDVLIHPGLAALFELCLDNLAIAAAKHSTPHNRAIYLTRMLQAMRDEGKLPETVKRLVDADKLVTNTVLLFVTSSYNADVWDGRKVLPKDDGDYSGEFSVSHIDGHPVSGIEDSDGRKVSPQLHHLFSKRQEGEEDFVHKYTQLADDPLSHLPTVDAPAAPPKPRPSWRQDDPR